MRQSARYWIDKLKLQRHPEGGYFRQTYKADLVIDDGALEGFDGARSASTAIYFLLDADDFSAFHRLRSDELWHFYAGSPLLVETITLAGARSPIVLGDDADAGQSFQGVVRAGCWFGSHVADWKSWALVGCTVAPGFEFADFEMGRRAELVQKYPQHREIIARLTRDNPSSAR